MGLLGRSILREIISGSFLGTLLFTFVLFLRQVNILFEQLVRGSASAPTVGYLLLLILPFALTFTLPLGVLAGVLIALSRMSSDGEITAMRAAGIPSRRVLTPVILFSVFGMLLTAACSLWLTPWSIRETYRVLNQLAAAQMTAEIQGGVFAEQFPNKTVYVSDVIAGPVVQWRNIFIADLTPPEQRKKSTQEMGDAPIITTAREAIAITDPGQNRIQLHMKEQQTHSLGKDSKLYYNVRSSPSDQVLEAQRPGETKAQAFRDMDTIPLWKQIATSREGAIEFHRRFSLPPACLLLALLGIPLGVSSRKAGKSAAFVITVFLAFVYWMAQISLIQLAQQGKLSVPLAAWLPNIMFATGAVLLTVGLENPGDRDYLGRIKDWFRFRFEGMTGWIKGTQPKARPQFGFGLRMLPSIVDTYILSEFFFYFTVWLVSFIAMTHVYNFFELMGHILRNNISMWEVAEYHFFLTPKLIYDSAPYSVLVAVLATFAILSKQNEVTAFKACGVSLYRLSLPVLMACVVLSAGLFAFDHYIIPDANLRQDGLRNKIMGKATQTWLRPDRKWIYGMGSRIFYYKHFDAAEKVMVGVHVYELDKATFQLRRHIAADRAEWQDGIHSWIFQNGWVRDFKDIYVEGYNTYQATTFPELEETPGYFLQEEKQYKQMNFLQLESYIQKLQQMGFDTVKLQVQYHRKFSTPLFALIMAALAVPFAFLTGSRGSMASIGVSFIVAIMYGVVTQLFEKVGNLNQLPPAVAAWAPDVVFALFAAWLFTRMRS